MDKGLYVYHLINFCIHSDDDDDDDGLYLGI